MCVACKSGAVGCTRRNVGYQLECTCGQKYVGETHRSLATRIKEHNESARNKVQGQPLGEHYRDRHSTESLGGSVTAFRKIEILATESDRARREAVYIRDIAPETNTSAGWELM